MNPESRASPVLPGGWLGMLGGGQLGRMFCQAAQRMGYRVAVLDPDPHSPAGAIANEHIVCAYEDHQGLGRLAERCPAISTEFENIPAQSLAWLADRAQVRPDAHAIAIAQDRLREKSFLDGAGIPVAPYAAVQDEAAFSNLPETLFPGILKVARFGYDGKGQAQVASAHEARQAWHAFDRADCVLEARQVLACEISVVLARNHTGQLACYPPVLNVHRDGILAVSTSGALADRPRLVGQARSLACDIAVRLAYVGVLCVEFFVLADGQLRVNEIAPRPHNSGHYSIDASICSQFEQQVRVLAGMPLGHTADRGPAIMLNLLGDVWFPGGASQMQEPDWERLLAIPGVHLHLYGKQAVRPGRKMGHVTITAPTLDHARQEAARVAHILGIPGP